MSRYSSANPDAPISHDWTGGTPDRRERVIFALPYPSRMDAVVVLAAATCRLARIGNGWPVHHVTQRTQAFGVAT